MAKQIREVELGEDHAKGPSLPVANGRRRRPLLAVNEPIIIQIRRDSLADATTPLVPQRAPVHINGIPCVLRHWTAEEWGRLPGEQRPAHAFRGDRGDCFAIDQATP